MGNEDNDVEVEETEDAEESAFDRLSHLFESKINDAFSSDDFKGTIRSVVSEEVKAWGKSQKPTSSNLSSQTSPPSPKKSGNFLDNLLSGKTPR